MRSVVPMIAVLGCGTPPQPRTELPPSPIVPAAKSPPRFVDFPVGVGTCKWISIGETSEIIGQQLQYLDPDDKAFSCVLVPAKGDGPIQPHDTADTSTAWESRPNVWVTFTGNITEWTPSAGIGERSVWESDEPLATLFIGVADTTLQIDVKLPFDQMPARAAERRRLVEAVARKVHVRLLADPAD